MKIINNSLAHKLMVLLLCVYFIFGAALLALRYWVPYQINDWRPQIEARLSKALDMDVSLENVNLHWYGWQPSILIEDLKLQDKQKNAFLEIPSVSMLIDWTALFKGYSGLINMHVRDLDLNILRTDSTHLNILGRELDLLGDNFDAEIFAAILDQPRILFTGATIHWQDLYRDASELKLVDVDLELAQDNQGNLGISMDAHLPQTSLAKIQLRGHLNKYNVKKSIESLNDFEVWLGVSNFKFSDWQYWIEIPDGLENNNANLQVWFDTKAAKRKVVLLAESSDVRFQPDSSQDLKINQADLWLENNLGNISVMDLINNIDENPTIFKDIKYSLDLGNIFLDDKNIFAYPLSAEYLKADGLFSFYDQFKLDITRASLQNQDIKLSSSGSWQAGKGAGLTDISGEIEYANLAAIYKYLPNDVDPDAHDWLKHGLLAGDLANGEFYLKGDVNEFPFGLKPESGDFMVAGNFTGGQIEFVPDAKPEDKWPQLYDMDGYAKLHRSRLDLQADTALVSPVDGSVIKLSHLNGYIPDIEFDSILSVTGDSQADGSAYIDLVKNSPLSHMLGNTFDEASASGDWRVPLALVVPLSNSIDTEVNGSILLTDAGLQFYPIAPEINKLNGEIKFNEQGIYIEKPVAGVFLGGPLKLNGSLGGENAKGLSADGLINAKALAEYVGLYGMRRLTGSLNFHADLKAHNNLYVISMVSDTENLELDFPAPLSKPAGDKRNLNIVWSELANNNENLKVSYGDVLKLDLLHTSGAVNGPYFHSAAIGVERAAKIEKTGLSIDIDYPLVDLDLWEVVTDEFGKPLNKNHKNTNTRVIWPDYNSFSLQADQLRIMGTRLDRTVLRAVRKDDINWSLNINSDQTNGNIKWQEKDGKIIGTVKASFDQLSLGDDPNDNNSLLPEAVDLDMPINDNLNIPGMVIEANNLKIFGKSFGHLNIEGNRDAARKLWVLDRLRLGSDDTAMLKGTGTWYLSGEQRGLQLNADVVLNDLGQWLTIAGWKDVLAGGAGDMKGKFFWKDLPWDTNVADLHGELSADLSDGRFIKLNSSSAKILELLSLQSITRLNRLERGLMDLTEDGFPFDQLQGNMKLEAGGADIIDYKLTGPVATILLEGKANIVRRDMDLDAVVVPNIDASGAAIAAGIAINPLVGLGAFVTQWLLKGPLAKSMTVRYKVSGSWDDPKTEEIPVSKK